MNYKTSITALVLAVITLGQVFNLFALNAEQKDAIQNVVIIVLGLFAADGANVTSSLLEKFRNFGKEDE